MNRLPTHKRALIIRCLVEGTGIRSTARTADVSTNTVSKLLRDAGEACAEYQDRKLRGLDCRTLEVDEIWSFVHAKKRGSRRTKPPPPGAGDVWTWTAIDPDTKLVPSWLVGDRSGESAIDFVDDLRSRLANRVQLTSEGRKPLLEAVEGASGADVDYAMLVKLYGTREDGERENRVGDAERNSLTTRMGIRRFGRLAGVFSKRVEDHAAAVSLHFMYYNFCRMHRSIKVTPAMEAGVTHRLYEISDIVKITDDFPPERGPHGPYKKRTYSNRPTSQNRIQDRENPAVPGLLIRLQPALCPTEDQFFEFCRINRDLRIERDAGGDITVMGPAGWETGAKNADITSQLQAWAIKNGTGRAVDSSAGYLLPNGAMRSPDASWVSNERLATVSPAQRLKFLPLCPDFVIELRSPTDRLATLRDKMAEYMANDAQLGWLIDPLNRQVSVYRPRLGVETLDAPERVSGDPVLEGFQLRLGEVW